MTSASWVTSPSRNATSICFGYLGVPAIYSTGPFEVVDRFSLGAGSGQSSSALHRQLDAAHLFGYSPFSLSVGGFLFDRFYRDWNEERLGGRVMVGYQISPDLSIATEIRAEDVDIDNPANNLNDKTQSSPREHGFVYRSGDDDPFDA